MSEGHVQISFCTAIRNRLVHLRETLPKNLAANSDYDNLQFVILDYNSSDGLEAWITSEMKEWLAAGRVVYHRVGEPTFFHRTHSRNLAFGLADGEVLCNVDADNFTGEGFARFVGAVFGAGPGIFLTPIGEVVKASSDALGRICVRKADFLRVGGFDERIEGHGFEDYDLVNRLQLAGLKKIVISRPEFLGAIAHDNWMRVKEERTYQRFRKLLIRYIDPWRSAVIVLFADGTAQRGTLIDERSRGLEYDYSLAEGDWVEGCPAETDGYYAITAESMVVEFILFHSQVTNRNKMTRAPGAPRENPAGAGHLFVSLFYPRRGWHLLLQAVIVPFVRKMETEFGRGSCVLHFSYSRGDQIGLSCRTPEGAGEDLRRALEQCANDFFSRNSLGEPDVSKHGTVFFMDFPVNSVQFGAHRFPFDRPEIIGKRFSFSSALVVETVTRNMLEVWGDEEIDGLAIITYAFYLQIIVLKYAGRYLADPDEFVRAVARSSAGGAALTEIIEAVLADEDGMGWRTEWPAVLDYVSELGGRADAAVILREYEGIMGVITTQLGLDPAVFGGFLQFANENKKIYPHSDGC